jgi:hypothetical protein
MAIFFPFQHHVGNSGIVWKPINVLLINAYPAPSRCFQSASVLLTCVARPMSDFGHQLIERRAGIS